MLLSDLLVLLASIPPAGYATEAGLDPHTPPDQRFPLSPIGKRAQGFMRVTTAHPDIGVPYTPVALLLDQYCGFNGFPLTQPRPWNVLEPTLADREISLFLDTIFPRSMYLDFIPGVDEELEDRRLVASPYGDCGDVLLSNVSLEILQSYPVVICLGPHEFLPETQEILRGYLAGGGRLFLTYAQAQQLGEQLAPLRQAGAVGLFGLRPDQISEPVDPVRWFTPAHWGADAATLGARKKGVELLSYEQQFKEEATRLLSSIAERYLPIRVTGDIEYLVNRTRQGWLLGLVNNAGVTKGNMTPVRVDPAQKKQVTVALRSGALAAVREWCLETDVPMSASTFQVEVPPGEVRIVEIAPRGL